MIQAVFDLVNLYLSMLIHYILMLPYVVRVMTGVVLLFLLIRLGLFCIKRIMKPVFLYFLGLAIKFLQLVIYAFAKMVPAYWNMGVGMDEALNSLGMRLEGGKTDNKENNAKQGKHLSRVFWVTLAAALVVIVVPYYLEPVLSGNAKEACKKVNNISENIQKGIQKYADNHYHVEGETGTSKSKGNKKKRVLHLNKKGYEGANLRKSPKREKGNVIATVSGDVKIYYEDKYVDDGKTVWLKVSTKGIKKAWISKKLIQKKDLKAAGVK